MNLYFQSYIDVLKRNFMLLFIACTFLVFTFFIWAGLPVFIVGDVITQLTTNLVIVHVCISLSGGFLFSLFFVPINLKVAHNIAAMKNSSTIRTFFHLQIIWLFVTAILFELAFMIARLF